MKKWTTNIDLMNILSYNVFLLFPNYDNLINQLNWRFDTTGNSMCDDRSVFRFFERVFRYLRVQLRLRPQQICKRKNWNNRIQNYFKQKESLKLLNSFIAKSNLLNVHPQNLFLLCGI